MSAVGPCVEGHPGAMGTPGIPDSERVKEIMLPSKGLEPKGEAMKPSEVWDHVDRMSRIHCCYAASGEKCQGYHPQGTRVIYGYEAMSKGVQGAVFSARNNVLEEAIGLVSELVAKDGAVLKSNVLEILSQLKLTAL
jgi:hypothetical protein